jgi:hypothetical protein
VPMPITKAIALRAIPFVLLWLAGLIFAAKMNFVFDYIERDKRIGHIDSALHVLPWITAEIIVLYALLRPNTFHLSWGHSLVALLVFAPWAYLHLMMVMHSPGWHIAHTLWLLTVNVALVTLTTGCIATRLFRSWEANRHA